MSKALQENVCYTRNMNIYAFLGTLILVLLVTRGIENLSLDIAPLLEEILWLGEVKKQNMVFVGPKAFPPSFDDD